LLFRKRYTLRVLEKERVGETGEINRDWYGKCDECGVNEGGKRGECFEKKMLFSRHTVFGTPCSLWAGRSGIGIAAGARDLRLVQNVQFSCGTHPAPSSFSTGVLSPG